MTPPASLPAPVLAPNLAPNLAMLRNSICDGQITNTVQFQPGLFLDADPGLNITGRYRSRSGRLLELDVSAPGAGNWIALHVGLARPDLSEYAYLGFTCRGAASKEQLIRPCLRSGTEDGFIDCFFDKHILALPEPRNHVDAMHLETRRDMPETAPWRELILFLPKHDFRWDLHDLRVFAI